MSRTVTKNHFALSEAEITRLPVRTASPFTKEQVKMLQNIAHPRIMAPNDYLFREGTAADRIFLVQSGSVKVYRLLKGEEISTMALYFPGDLFGEPDPDGKAIHQYRAVAVEPTVIGEITQKDLKELVKNNGKFAESLVAWSGLMHRITQSKLRDFLHYGKSGALCALLLRLSNTYAAIHDGKRYIDKRITNAEMADMISSTRESVNRLLGDLRSKNVISMLDGKIVLLDIPYLQQVCNCDNCPLEVCRM
ncbi:Crp/Fnr family transcriptional regulator [Paenibacillus yanchengensis]|uniref:Crp/Fnr family transcriptional regulator n=1 Tax=Paenibacillus yanchengensis TaxID=2035833 RepID=A0ABW4YP80_9BACL